MYSSTFLSIVLIKLLDYLKFAKDMSQPLNNKSPAG